MNPDTATLRRYGLAMVASAVTTGLVTYAGVRLWKAHPVLGGVVGFFIVAPVFSIPLSLAIAPEFAAQLPVRSR